jgi:outer membrane immunogenic protein
MNKLLIAGVALAAASLGGPALAADMPLKALPPVVVYNWTGCYTGLFIGDETGRFSSRDALDVAGVVPAAGQLWNDNTHMSGFIGGATVGCNYQVYNWVWGIEVDQGISNKAGQDFLLPPFNPLFVNKLEEQWLGTARLRLGYAVTDKWLWYVTGGAAYAKLTESAWNITNPVPTAQIDRHWVSGWTVGVGTEYAVGYGWSIKSEFLYVDLGTHRFFTPTPGIGVNSAEDTKVRDYVFKFGMNYKFGWVGKSPAVVAKY